jgi:hypothetical protein
MSIPNTNTFSLNDVRVEVGLAANTNLIACFAAANNSFFDPAYVGTKDRLSNFRNYNGAANTLSVSPGTFTRTSAAFNVNANITSNTTWSVSDNAAWLSFSPSSGSGNGVLSISGTVNGTGITRIGTITIDTTSGAPPLSVAIIVEQSA